MKLILSRSFVTVLILAVLFSCAKKHTDGGALRSLGDFTANGPQIDGSVHASTKVLYTLKDIHQDQNYTLRVEIGLLPDGPDGKLTADIYTSADAFRNDPGAPFGSAVPAIIGSNIYEVNFSAESSGDYVIVLSGDSRSVPGIQFFYNLRLMSADLSVMTAQLTPVPPVSSETITTYEVLQTNPLNPNYLNIYSGGTVTPSRVYSITLVSNATVTLANPQVFVYLDSSLTLSSLMLSSIPTTKEFVITRFNAGVPGTANELGTSVNTNVISNVTFTNQADDSVNHVGSPFIVLKGLISAVTYTLSIGP